MPGGGPNIARRAAWTLNFIDNSTLQIPFDWWFQRWCHCFQLPHREYHPTWHLCLKSGVIFKNQCPRCTACYVGAITRHVITRFKEQIGTKEKSVYKHLMACDARSDVSEKNLYIVCSTLRGEVHLLTLEALWIRDMKPSINVKDEYKSRELVIKF